MSGPRLVAAALQLNSQDDLCENLAACRKLLLRAAERGAQIAVLPENFAFFGADRERQRVAEQLGDLNAPIQSFCAELCRETGLVIVAGGFPELSADPERPYNTCAVFDPAGRPVASYRKMHLFDVDLMDGTRLSESSATTHGDQAVTAEVLGLRVGLSICYDLRFPELYRLLAADAADVIVVPSAFTLHTGKDHWRVLLRARAIENQCWFVAAAQWGKHPRGRTTYGHALIADPWGAVVAECSDGTGMAIAELDFDHSAAIRRSLPALRHRRFE